MTPHYRDRNNEKSENRYSENSVDSELDSKESVYVRRTSKLDAVMDTSTEIKEDTKQQKHFEQKDELPVENPKEERKRKQKESAFLQKHAIIIASLSVFILIILCLLTVFIVGKIKENKAVPNMENSVLCIDGEYFSKEQFTFFCSMVIESPGFYEISKDTQDSSLISDRVKERAVILAEEFTCKIHEAEKNGVALSDEEKNTARKELKKSGFDTDEYTQKHYGMSYNDYFELCCDMRLLGKYIDEVGNRAIVDEDSQRVAFEQNEEKLSSTEVKMVYYNIFGLDETDIIQKRLTAESLLEQVQADRSKISELSLVRSDENHLFDITKENGDITVTLDYYDNASYSELCVAVSQMNVGEVKLIETSKEICVVLCEKKNGFETICGTDEMISITRQIYLSDYFDTVMETGKYSAQKNEKFYKEVDLTAYVQSALGTNQQGK